nr:thermonuclease family protein [Falsiruegeria litorea]
MEFVVVGALILIGILVVVFRADRDDAIEPFDPFDPKSRKLRPVKSQASVKRSSETVVRIDESKAKHLAKPRIVTGSAWITDGDTITINKTQIRLFGIDAPELNHPYGVKAKWSLHKLCKGHEIRAEIEDEDDYGRTVAKCYLPDGRDLSAEMVKQGMAIDWPKYSGKKYTHLETPDARKKLFLADARQKGRMHVWKQYEARQQKQ